MAYKLWKLLFFFLLFTMFIETSQSDEISEELNIERLKKLAIANNDLGFKLYKLLANDTSGNVVFSPFGLSNAFGMLFAGAAGNTADQLMSVLGYEVANLESSHVPSAFNQYLDMVLPENLTQNSENVLNIANEMLLAEDFKVYPEYKKQVQELFYAYIKDVDFKKNSAQILQDVNNWVKEQTHGKINKLINNFDPSTVMLILNAIYFKGTWKSKFNKKMTKAADFYNYGSNNKSKKVPFMNLRSEFSYASLEDLEALELPYKGDNISMIVLLPKDHYGLPILENNITSKKLQDIQRQMHPVKVTVTFPKFKVKYKRKLNSKFKKLGATDIFNPASANFSGITSDKELYVNQVFHKAVIEVNEDGSEATAATKIGFSFRSKVRTPMFTVDHPFMFAIIDKRNNLILFLGRVNKL